MLRAASPMHGSILVAALVAALVAGLVTTVRWWSRALCVGRCPISPTRDSVGCAAAESTRTVAHRQHAFACAHLGSRCLRRRGPSPWLLWVQRVCRAATKIAHSCLRIWRWGWVCMYWACLRRWRSVKAWEAIQFFVAGGQWVLVYPMLLITAPSISRRAQAGASGPGAAGGRLVWITDKVFDQYMYDTVSPTQGSKNSSLAERLETSAVA